MAQFSDETENEDQVDHFAIYNNGFPTYLNFRTGLPKGDFCFGENELDMELDIVTDFRRNFNHIPAQQDWSLPNEAFHIRHEIRDRYLGFFVILVLVTDNLKSEVPTTRTISK